MNPPTTRTGDRGLTCEDVMRHLLAEKYVSGELSEQQATEFEQHFFVCARCFEELQAYQTVQQGLTKAAPQLRAAETQKAGTRGWAPRWALVAAVAAIVLAASVMLLRSPKPTQTAKTAVTAPPISNTQPSGKNSSAPDLHAPSTGPSPALLAELGRVLPPRYNPVVLRGPEDDATVRFQEAMREYQRGNYTAAIRRLQTARRLRPNAADINFYLGVSYLLAGQREKAIEQLRRTTQLPDGAFANQAHFYLAKAYLQLGDAEKASSELKKIISAGGEQAHDAQKILQQMRTPSPGFMTP